MALKTFLLITLSVAVMATIRTGAQFGDINTLLGLIRIQGTVYCSMNDTMSNIASSPPFSNAVVQLKCGENVISSTTTNGSGHFSATLDPFNFIVSSLLNSCNLKVATPLSSCDSALPSAGGLLSALQFIGNTFVGQTNIGQMNIIPAGFQFVPSH
ncbi:hypothetical protein JCGZ_18893 [Jatropha curcas]|uniref:Uncharacterized protein n=1 Tax=Jatropha curcas TaxID=180498 RepID=A0A067JYF9_JATCU|nr:phylloplanin [Jatropha curcas]KDP27813.1 hypothetical protein JCGZ_18893 [Jatropha curcas]